MRLPSAGVSAPATRRARRDRRAAESARASEARSSATSRAFHTVSNWAPLARTAPARALSGTAPRVVLLGHDDVEVALGIHDPDRLAVVDALGAARDVGLAAFAELQVARDVHHLAGDGRHLAALEHLLVRFGGGSLDRGRGPL